MSIRALKDITRGLVVAGLLVGCDSPVEPVTHAAGVVIVDASGNEAARFIFDESSPVISGGREVGVQETVTYRVRGLDEDGAVFSLDEGGYSISNPVVVIGLRADIAVDGIDALVLEGLDPGETTIRFSLHHGDHPEFEARDIPLQVIVLDT